MSGQFLSGIVEGFYGQQWSWQDRLAYADYLVEHGLNSYIYCPKGDAYLRKQWREQWPESTFAELRQQAKHYRSLNLGWGVGLSPYALFRDYSRAEKASLQAKVQLIDSLGGNLLAVLFDDMPGDCPDLAERQAEIVADVQCWTSAQRVLVCPTYYSFDPVLERYFGAMPTKYWEQLGAALPAEVDVFWTGPAVCSAVIGSSDIASITARLGRAPLLWDNYPVNDGEKASNYLHLSPLSGRAPELRQLVTGHLCNPMNQANLSRYPLSGLASLYGAAPSSLERCYGDDLGRQLRANMLDFSQRGLQVLSAAKRQALAERYADFEHPAATEVVAWLEGKYRFDPACLTG